MESLDVHKAKKRIESAIKSFISDEFISEGQKKKFLRFIEEARMGKNSKKKVGDLRLIRYVYNFIKLVHYFKKDIDDVTEKEIETFYKDLEADRIKSKKGRPYKPATKNELIKIFKKYLKWTLKNEEKYEKLIGWIKKYSEMTEKPAITLQEAEKMANARGNPRDKAIIMFLFDSGCRISEALNLHLNQIEKKEKTRGKGEYYLVNIKVSKTLPRRISIPLAAPHLTEWFKVHPDRNNEQAYLFPIEYNTVLSMLIKISKRVLGKKVTPHSLRHSSATYYARKLKPYPFCYRYGWTIGSSSARRYIDRNLLGEEEQENLVNIIDDDKLQKLEEENKKLKESISILKSEQEKIISNLKRRERLDPLLTKLCENEKFLRYLRRFSSQ